MIEDRRQTLLLTAIIGVVVASGVGVAFLDPGRVAPDTTTADVSPEQSPSTIYYKSAKATFTGAYTLKHTEYKTTQQNQVEARSIRNVTSNGEYFEKEYVEANYGNSWFLVTTYRGEHVTNSRAGYTTELGTSPERIEWVNENANVAPPMPANGRVPGDIRLTFENPSELRIIDTTDSQIILGINNETRYRQFSGSLFGDSEIKNASVRIYINRETGRITKIEQSSYIAVENDDDRIISEVYKTSNFGDVTVERPDWGDRTIMEYVYDAIIWDLA